MKRKLKKIVTYIIMTAVLSSSNSFMVHAEDITDTEAEIEMEASTDAGLENDTEASDDVEALSVTEAVDEYMPVGGWKPAEIHYVEDVEEKKEDTDGLRYVENVINSASYVESVFSKGVGTVGYNALTKEAQKEFYNNMDAVADSFMNATKDLKATKVTYTVDSEGSETITNYIYIIGILNYSSLGISLDEAYQAYFAYDYDHPAYYWISNSLLNNDTSIYLCTEEEYSKISDRDAINEKIEAGAEKYAEMANSLDDTLDKIAVIHDLIIQDVDYAYDGGVPVEEKWAHSVQGVFDGHNEVVCEGYADTFSLMMNYLDIPNYYIVGTAGSGGGGGHAWNVVSCDGGTTYMYMDLTWDDLSDEKFYDKYFGMPQSDFETSHTAFKPENTGNTWLYALPENINDNFSGTYYNMAGFYFNSSDCSLERAKMMNTKIKRFHNNLTFISDDYTSYAKMFNYLGLTNVVYYEVTYGGTIYYTAVLQMTEPLDISESEIVLTESDYAYTGDAIEPKPQVTLNGIKLIEGLNYTVSYLNNINESTDILPATVTAMGKENFTGEKSANFNILEPVLKSNMVSLSADTFLYDGQTKKPDIKVIKDEVELIENTDYSVVFSEDEPKNAGTYSVTIIGRDTNFGTVTMTFTIEKRPVTVSGIKANDKTYDKTTKAVLDYSDVIYDGLVDGDSLTVSAVGTFSDALANSDKTVNITDLVLGGESLANYILAESNQQTVAIASIIKANPVITTIPKAVSGLVYTGEPQVLITGGRVSNGTLYYSLDGSKWSKEIADIAKTEVGTYEVYYKVVGDTNYNDISSEKILVEIAKADNKTENNENKDDNKKSDSDSDNTTGSETETKTDDKSDDNTNDNTDKKSDGNTDTKADEKSDEQKSDDKTEAKTGDKTDDKTGTKSDDKTDDKAGEKSTEEKVEPVGEEFASYQGCDFYEDEDGDVRCYDDNGKPVINNFKCDGEYTYYFQLDGTAMKDRLTYHPDGEHVIYFDENGHEVFSDFAHVKKTIAGEDVDDYCFFNVFGYMYVDVLTYDKSGTVLYYANPYGVMEMGKWFQFSDTVVWADGTEAVGIAGGYGYANSDGTLLTNTPTFDWEGRPCYMQGNGVALY